MNAALRMIVLSFMVERMRLTSATTSNNDLNNYLWLSDEMVMLSCDVYVGWRLVSVEVEPLMWRLIEARERAEV